MEKEANSLIHVLQRITLWPDSSIHFLRCYFTGDFGTKKQKNLEIQAK